MQSLDKDAPEPDESTAFLGLETTTATRLPHGVLVADRLPKRLRRTEDLLEAGACLLGIIAIILLGIYAHSTTQGVAEDVRSVLGALIKQVVLLPISVLESLFVLIAPTSVIIALIRRRRGYSIIAVVVTALVSALAGWGIVTVIPLLPAQIIDSLMISTPSGATVSIDVVIVVLAASFTVAGEGGRIRSIKFSWYGIWLLLIIGIIRGSSSLPGMIVTVLLGRMFGCLARWIMGFDDRRALPADLVEAVLNMGFLPRRIIRSDLNTEMAPLQTWIIRESTEDPDLSSGTINPHLTTEIANKADATYEVAPQLEVNADRRYQVTTQSGETFDLHVLDPTRAVTNTISELWNNFRLRGISRWVSPSVKGRAERSALTSLTASSSGVQTPRPLGMASAGDSVASAWQIVPATVPLLMLTSLDLPLHDDLMTQAWDQLRAAHARSICHRNLDEASLAVTETGTLWITDWEQGDVACSELNKHIDCAQMLVHLSLAVGPERALESAAQEFTRAELVAIAMVMQPTILPPRLRARLRRTSILDTLRTELAKNNQDELQPVVPMKLERFSVKTVVLFTIGVVALVSVLGSLNFSAVVAALKDANVWWIVAAFFLGATTWLGAAIPLVAFAPKKLHLWPATLVQAAASIVTVVAPAGIGPAALNLRYLTKQKIKMPVAVATVSLVQISQFLTSVILLVVLVAVTGTNLNVAIPTMTIIWVGASLVATLTAILAIPKVRKWVWGKLGPFWNQMYPQLLWVIGHPKELLVALGGNLITNLGFIGAFAAALAAFGHTLSPMTITITYLVSNTLGSVIPAPGGIGPVEAALTGGLQVAGIPPAIALSTAVVYRLVTFYGRIPFGWLALRLSQRKDLI